MTAYGNTPDPPRLAEALLERFLPSGDLGRSIRGDLLQEFTELSGSRSTTVARKWYWRQALAFSARYAFAKPGNNGSRHRDKGTGGGGNEESEERRPYVLPRRQNRWSFKKNCLTLKRP